MSTMMERMRNRRNTNRRNRMIAEAIRVAPSPSMRNELLEMANRYQ